MSRPKGRGSTPRIVKLHQALMRRAMSDRSSEWLRDDMFVDIAPNEDAQNTPVILRRAKAFKEVLRAMSSPKCSVDTRTFEIEPGELLVGSMPLGSLGLGKVFPNYLTEMEKDVAFYCSRGVESNLGHNSPDYTRVVQHGLESIVTICRERIRNLDIDLRYPMGRTGGILKKKGFYRAVEICCKASIAYAQSFSRLARKQAATTDDPGRKKELQEIAAICRKVPRYPAETFQEALQSIWFVHLIFHATVSHLSLGRLDQVLQPYLEQSLASGELDEEEALELLECFFLKCAGRLNLNPAYFEKQDHTDFGTSMGHSPFLLDQEVTVNQFMQNIVVGGVLPDGTDGENRCTHLFLDACANLKLSTPTLNVRLSKKSSKRLLRKVAECVERGDNGQPIIYNEGTIISGLMQGSESKRTRSGEKKPSWSIEQARDFVVDGCWEALLNGVCDFTYNMVHLLPVLECSLNRGALLTQGKMQLRGAKKSYMTADPAQMESFADLQEAFRTHLRLFTKKVGMELYTNFCLEGSVTPAPFFSALLGRCLEKGIDKTWGGADHIIGGIVFIAAPNVANSLAAIRKWVFDEQKYALEDVVRILRCNYHKDAEGEGHSRGDVKLAERMWKDFRAAPKFGNGNAAVDKIMRWLLDEIYGAVLEAQALADHVFLTIPSGSTEGRKIAALRKKASYPYGKSMRERYGNDFDIRFTAGCGTFAQYAWFGIGQAANADGRLANDPVAPNFSPASGTARHGVGGVIESLRGLRLERFGCGVMTDVTIQRNDCTTDLIEGVLRKHLHSGGSIMSLTIPDKDRLVEIYHKCKDVRVGKAKPRDLNEYTDVTVRVGGWNGAFVTLTAAQQEDYLRRLGVPSGT